MKTILLIGFIVGSSIYAQNAFVDGIHDTKQVAWKDGETRFSGLGFKIEFIGTCTGVYTATEMLFEFGSENSNVVQTKFQWMDIASIEIDSVKHIMRFNGRNPLPCSREDINTKIVTKDPDNNVLNIYFKTTLMCRNAANWSLEHIKICGGKATLIN